MIARLVAISVLVLAFMHTPALTLTIERTPVGIFTTYAVTVIHDPLITGPAVLRIWYGSAYRGQIQDMQTCVNSSTIGEVTCTIDLQPGIEDIALLAGPPCLTMTAIVTDTAGDSAGVVLGMPPDVPCRSFLPIVSR